MIFKGKEVDISTLKTLNYEDLDDLCFEIRNEIIKAVSLNGGHLSSNLGAVELEVALMRFFSFPKDKLLIDVGHQAYTYKLLTGRDLSTLRKKNGISGFLKRSESVYDIFEGGHSSTSLSASLGIALSRDLNNEDYEVVNLIGDASILNGMALEALNDIGQKDNKIIIILNDNNMSVSKTVGALHNSLDASSFYHEFGLDYIGPINGHNIKEIEDGLRIAKSNKKSIVVHVLTEKGKGYVYSENDKIGLYHGIAPFKVKTGLPKVEDNFLSYSSLFGNLVYNALNNDKLVVCINPAMVLGSGLREAFSTFKDRCFDVGIAEEHAITLASGFSINGYKPIVSLYSTFLQRGFDQVSHDIARMNLKSLFLIDRSGLIGEDGDTHVGIFDEAFLLNTPNTTVVVPSSKETASILFKHGLNHNYPYFIRYPKGRCYVENKVVDFSYGEWRKLLANSSETCLIVVGDTVHFVKEELIKRNINVTLFDALYLNNINKNILDELLTFKKIMIVNPLATENGFNNKLISYLYKSSYKGEIRSYAVKEEFILHASKEEQEKESSVDTLSIINNLLDFLN